MSNPKRVWDSKKRAVRQGKEQVWLVDGEKKVNTNHGFAEATGTDVVYDSSWEEAQTPLQTYENGWENIPTPPPSSSITINKTLSQATGEVGSQIGIYLLCENAITLSDPAPVLEFVELVHETGEGYNKIAKYNVVAQGTKTLSFSDNITGDSDSIEFTGTPGPSVRINRVLTPSVGICGNQFTIYANVDNVESADLTYSSSNENISIESGSIELGQEGYNLIVHVNCYNPAEGIITITDNTTGDSDSISIEFIKFDVWTAPVYVNRDTHIQYRYLTSQGVLGEIEAWVEDDSIMSVKQVDQPNEEGYGNVLVGGLTEGTTTIHIRPHNYPEVEYTESMSVTQYVSISEISNLSTSSVTVFAFESGIASFDYTPVNASNPSGEITIQPKAGSTDYFNLYISGYGEGVFHLGEGNAQYVELGTQSTYQIINNNDQSNVLEITLTKGKGIEAITLDSEQATTTVGADTTVSFTYTPTDGDTDCLYVQGDGTDYCSVSISGTGGNGTITITGTNAGIGGFDIYAKGNGNTLGYVYVTVTAPQ